MCFVTTMRNGQKEVYLPGSSLKGVIRSHSEKICRTLQAQSVCEPFNPEKKEIPDKNKPFISCSQYFKNPKNTKANNSYAHYKASCPACRMFGSLKFKGRCFIDDAYAVGEAPRPHIRDGVGIDRFKGSAKVGAKYDFEVITEGTFATEIHLVNFEMWQLELLLFTLRDLASGHVRIGMATSRGLGKIKVQITNVEYHQVGETPGTRAIKDISALEKDQNEIDDYGFYVGKNTIDADKFAQDWKTLGIRHVLKINPENLFQDISDSLAGELAQYLKSNANRQKIKKTL